MAVADQDFTMAKSVHIHDYETLSATVNRNQIHSRDYRFNNFRNEQAEDVEKKRQDVHGDVSTPSCRNISQLGTKDEHHQVHLPHEIPDPLASLSKQTPLNDPMAYPWVPARPLYEASLMGLNEELYDIVHWLAKSKEEKSNRIALVSRLSSDITELWIDAKVETIGSLSTDMDLPTSDVDIVVTTSQTMDIVSLFQLAKHLHSKGTSEEEPLVITAAKVPIVKVKDAASGVYIDIAINVNAGIATSKAMNAWAKELSLLRPLVLLLKHCLRIRGLNDTRSGGLGSYALALMVVTYLKPKIATSIINVANPQMDIATAFLGFLEYFGRRFDLTQNVLCPGNDRVIVDKAEKGWCHPIDSYAIEDPCNPADRSANNVSASASRSCQVRDLFALMYHRLLYKALEQHRPQRSLLRHVLWIPFEVRRARAADAAPRAFALRHPHKQHQHQHKHHQLHHTHEPTQPTNAHKGAKNFKSKKQHVHPHPNNKNYHSHPQKRSPICSELKQKRLEMQKYVDKLIADKENQLCALSS